MDTMQTAESAPATSAISRLDLPGLAEQQANQKQPLDLDTASIIAPPPVADRGPLASAPAPIASGLDIGHVVVLMKAGHAVARAGWNGKGMFLYYVQANSYPAQSIAAKRAFGPDAMVPYQAYIAMKTADGTVVPWLASQTDLLASDWQIIEGQPDVG